MADEPTQNLVHHEGRRYAYDQATDQLYDVDFPDKRTDVSELEAILADRIARLEAQGGLRENRDACEPLASLSAQLDAAIGRDPSLLTRKLATAWQLPVVELAEGKFFIDRRLSELRNVDDPHDTIDLTEFQVELLDMARQIGRDGGIDAAPERAAALIQRAEAFHRAIGNDPVHWTEIIKDTIDAQTPSHPSKRHHRRP